MAVVESKGKMKNLILYAKLLAAKVMYYFVASPKKELVCEFEGCCTNVQLVPVA